LVGVWKLEHSKVGVASVSCRNNVQDMIKRV